MRGILDRYNNFAENREIVALISRTFHIPPAITFTALLTGILVLLFQGIGTMLISNFFFLFYPAYMTFKSFKSGRPELLLRFGKYWIVLGFTAFFYMFTEWLLQALPFFGFLKVSFAYFLIRNEGWGATYVYDYVVRPIFSRYESFIDARLADIHRTVERTVEAGKQQIKDVKNAAIAQITKETEKTH